MRRQAVHHGIADVMARQPLFSALDRSDLVLLARLTEPVEVGAGRTIVLEGEIGHHFYVVIDGTAVVLRGGHPVGLVGPGGWFGELSLLLQRPRDAGVRSTEPLELLAFGRREFMSLLGLPAVTARLLSHVARRLYDTEASPVVQTLVSRTTG